MMDDASPTARALVALELIQGSPGITADRVGERLGVSERAARRYVAVLRAAGVPIESARGRYGGYRVGRGHRIPPMMFSLHEALALVMAVLEGPHGAVDDVDVDADDPVVTALRKIVRVLPEPIATPVEAVRRGSARRPDPAAVTASPEITAALAMASAARQRVRVHYRLEPGREREMDVDPWAVVVRHGRWYLLCWSHTRQARRVLRVDRVVAVKTLEEPFTPPDDLDPMWMLEAHLSEGWRYRVEVEIEAPATDVAHWIPRKLGRLESVGEGRTRLVGSTNEPDWYAEKLAALRAPFEIVEPPELRAAAEALGQRLLQAAAAWPPEPAAAPT